MGKANKKSKVPAGTIGLNKKARFEFHIEEDFEAGVALEGWEVKALRAGRLQLQDAYAFIKNGEVFISNILITPLQTVSTHITPDPKRIRKLLLHRREIDKLIGGVERQGYTIVPLSMYWKNNMVKIKIALVKGKQLHDKRQDAKDKDWKRDQARIMKNK